MAAKARLCISRRLAVASRVAAEQQRSLDLAYARIGKPSEDREALMREIENLEDALNKTRMDVSRLRLELVDMDVQGDHSSLEVLQRVQQSVDLDQHVSYSRNNSVFREAVRSSIHEQSALSLRISIAKVEAIIKATGQNITNISELQRQTDDSDLKDILEQQKRPFIACTSELLNDLKSYQLVLSQEFRRNAAEKQNETESLDSG